MTALALKPCPFCGAVPETGVWQKVGLTVQCSSSLTDCPVCPGYSHYEPMGAVAAWNARALDWRPISEAPQDGTRLMLWDSVSQRPVFGSWRGDNPAITHYAAEPAGPGVS